MVDLPVWIYADRGPKGGLIYREQRMPDTVAEYVRADLYEQVKRENQKLRGDCKAYEKTMEAIAAAEAAERLAGARVKALDEDDYEEITNAAGIAMRRASRGIRGQVITVQDSFDWWVMKETERRILSALAEPAGEFDKILSDSSEFVASLSDSMRATGRSVFNPPESAGEAEPRQFLPTEDGEFNGNTFSDDPVPFGWITQSAYDRVNYSSLPEEVTIIRNAVGPTGMPRVALYTTPPDASAIRGALEAIRALSGLDGELCKASATIMSRMADIHQTADAALAGAKP